MEEWEKRITEEAIEGIRKRSRAFVQFAKSTLSTEEGNLTERERGFLEGVVESFDVDRRIGFFNAGIKEIKRRTVGIR